MPILKNAKKALRVAKRKAEMNRPVRSRLKTAVDAAKKGTGTSLELLSTAFSAIDKAVKNHLIHRKKAAHMKSSLAKASSSTATPKPDAEKKAAPKAKAKTAKPAAKKPAAKKSAAK